MGPLTNCCQYGIADLLDVKMRVRCARAMEARGLALQPIVAGIEVLMLPGEDQGRLQADCRESSGDGRELDRFGPRADNQPDIRERQISP